MLSTGAELACEVWLLLVAASHVNFGVGFGEFVHGGCVVLHLSVIAPNPDQSLAHRNRVNIVTSVIDFVAFPGYVVAHIWQFPAALLLLHLAPWVLRFLVHLQLHLLDML